MAGRAGVAGVKAVAAATAQGEAIDRAETGVIVARRQSHSRHPVHRLRPRQRRPRTMPSGPTSALSRAAMARAIAGTMAGIAASARILAPTGREARETTSGTPGASPAATKGGTGGATTDGVTIGAVAAGHLSNSRPGLQRRAGRIRIRRLRRWERCFARTTTSPATNDVTRIAARG